MDSIQKLSGSYTEVKVWYKM